jgi:hypothetical protein
MQVLFQLSYSPTGRAVYQRTDDEPESGVRRDGLLPDGIIRT